ncbi:MULTISPECIES: hypothetical protein [unclassified Coleofasciculus]|uniref:hypothetical protein n=1 Tax=unclassified Coleofasciculus TaxID=2692782 RepID=UPI00187E405E|nr:MULTISPECIES: hypothetical protein [unclassified Coleofasciculus]MBE9125051.1 hypothetical protein [Coleofasciculus sp. LEGE 07081]MBE9147629.1 hypothetical protein [Coleofasciculus sp. LEGE 07092]
MNPFLNLLILVLLGVYGYGVWKFWKGFNRTNFNPSLPNRLYLSLLWPALLVMNKSYRKNFTKALKGH